MKTILLFSVCILIVCNLVSCNIIEFQEPEPEEEPTLPEATEEGLDIFACFINGEVFTTKTYVGFPIHANYYPKHPNLDTVVQGILQISGYNKVDREYANTAFSIFYKKIWSEGIYEINKPFSLPISNNGGKAHFSIQGKDYINTEESSNLIEVTKLDSAQRIVSGTFSFNLVNEDNPDDTLRLTNGRFDIKFNY